MTEYIKTWNQLNALNYELYCMKYHRENYGHETYHWYNVPESILFKSGYIHEFNELRLTRKRVLEEEGRYYNRLRDYGFDGLSIESNDDNFIYNGIQCKLWNNTLTANDLGTFLIKILEFKVQNQGSKGYLYHTCDLQVDLRDGMLRSREFIINQKLDYNEEIQQQFLNEVNLISDQSYEESESVESLESNFKLRGYQMEAIEALNQDWDGVKLLNLPCGTGKTVIFANHVRDKAYKNIFIISPKKVHVKQNLDRIKSFVPDYETLLLDSDKEGSTSFEDLENILDKNSVVSTTLDSAETLFRQLFYGESDIESEYDESSDNEESDSEDESIEESIESDEESQYESNYDLSNSILIIDEAHNLLNRDELIKIVKSFPKVLLVTATPPSSMEEILGCEIIYKYPFRKAIEEGYICDYQVYLPLLTTNEENVSSVLIEKPLELNDLDDVMTKKCLYLFNGMLQTGSRKCIVYLSSHDDCRLFINTFNEVNNRYHYLPVWTNMIISDISQAERTNILRDFQRESDELKILCSIQILDEGVDIPSCDSVFITNVSEHSSSIRTVQRICRANRKVDNNPNKKANCFLWTDDLNSIVGCLSLLKENDIEFHRKIRMINNDYTLNNNIERKEFEVQECEKMNDFIRVKCMSLEDIWEMKRHVLFRFCDEYSRVPKNHESFENIKIGQWFGYQKKIINKKWCSVYNILSKNYIVKNELDRYLNEKELRSKQIIYSFEEKKKLLIKYVNENNRVPSQGTTKCKNNNLGVFYNAIKCKVKNNLSPIYREYQHIGIIKTDFDRLINNRIEKSKRIKYTKEEKKNLLIKYVNENNKVPSGKIMKYENFYLGYFYTDEKKKIKDNQSLIYKEYQHIPLIISDFDRLINKRKAESAKNQYTIEEKKNLLIKFVNEKYKVPSGKKKIYENFNISSFYSNLKKKVEDNQSAIYIEYQNIEFIKKDFDRYLKEKEKRNEEIDYTVEEKKNLLIKYVNENNKVPIASQIFEKFKLGVFYSSLKQKVEEKQ